MPTPGQPHLFFTRHEFHHLVYHSAMPLTLLIGPNIPDIQLGFEYKTGLRNARRILTQLLRHSISKTPALHYRHRTENDGKSYSQSSHFGIVTGILELAKVLPRIRSILYRTRHHITLHISCSSQPTSRGTVSSFASVASSFACKIRKPITVLQSQTRPTYFTRSSER